MKALIIVDMQYDFLPGGSLAVDKGDEIIPVINRMIPYFDLVVATQDWHPADHASFASNHRDKKPGEIVELNGMDQVLWPDHCVQNTHGAAFHPSLNAKNIAKVFQKGTDKNIDSYSGFYDNGHLKSTGLADYLRSEGVSEVYVTGLATDYCVQFTALDAVMEQFKTYVIADATRAVNLQSGDDEKAIKNMQAKGVGVVSSSDLLDK